MRIAGWRGLQEPAGGEERAAYHWSEARAWRGAAIKESSISNSKLYREKLERGQNCAQVFPPKVRKETIIEPGTFTIVSGLPRSGTSLMMQMLKAGGLEVMTDHERAADQDNPEGYFEWDEIKQVGENPDLLANATGRAIKAISALILALAAGPSLPRDLHEPADRRSRGVAKKDDRSA